MTRCSTASDQGRAREQPRLSAIESFLQGQAREQGIGRRAIAEHGRPAARSQYSSTQTRRSVLIISRRSTRGQGRHHHRVLGAITRGHAASTLFKVPPRRRRPTTSSGARTCTPREGRSGHLQSLALRGRAGGARARAVPEERLVEALRSDQRLRAQPDRWWTTSSSSSPHQRGRAARRSRAISSATAPESRRRKKTRRRGTSLSSRCGSACGRRIQAAPPPGPTNGRTQSTTRPMTTRATARNMDNLDFVNGRSRRQRKARCG